MSAVQIQRLHTLKGHRNAIYTLQSAGQPSRFFSGSGDGMVVAWDLLSPEEGELIAKLPNSVYALNHLSQGDILVVGHNYEGIHFLDWRNKKELTSLKLSTAAIFDIQLIGGQLLVACGDGSVTMVDVENMRVMKRVQAGEKSARTVAVNARTGEIAVGYSDHFIRVFDERLEMKREWRAHQNSVFTLRFSPDEKLLLSGSRDARLKVWDVDEGYAAVEEIAAHMYAINHITYSPDGKHFVTCSMDKSIKVWDAAAFKLLKVIDKARHAGHGTSVNKLLWTDYRHELLSASDDRSISVWQIIF